MIYFLVFAPNFLKLNNLTNLLTQTTIPSLLVTGVAMVVISGGMDLSVGSTLALSGCICGLMLRAGLPLLLCIAVGILTGTLIGLLNGLMIAKMRLPSFIATLAMLNMASGLTNTLSGKKPIYWDANPVLNFIGNGKLLGMPIFVIIGFSVIAIVIFFFYRTRLKTYTYALGGNEEVLHLSGISVTKWKLIVYSLSGFLAGVAGMMMIARANCADPTSGTGLEFSAVVGAVIGGNVQKTGKGTLFGALLGAITLSVLRNGMSLMMLQTHWQMVITGIVLVFGMLIHDLSVKQEIKQRLRDSRGGTD